MQSPELEYLTCAALKVEQQALGNPGVGIPVDPDVAEFMGAFEGHENTSEVMAATLGESGHVD